jgi:hypothetical protein
MQRALARYSVTFAREQGHRLQLRLGLNTGPVIVGMVGNNLRMDYNAVGDTVNLAARMEQTAEPGTVRVTGEKGARGLTGFIGRERELVLLRNCFERAKDPNPTGQSVNNVCVRNVFIYRDILPLAGQQPAGERLLWCVLCDAYQMNPTICPRPWTDAERSVEATRSSRP